MGILNPVDLLHQLTAMGIAVTLEGDLLKFRPGPPMELRPAIKANKPELVKLLAKAPKPMHPEHREMLGLVERIKQDRARLLKALEANGRRLGWPRIRLHPWSHLIEGQDHWRAYLNCPHHGPDELRQLLEALADNGQQ